VSHVVATVTRCVVYSRLVTASPRDVDLPRQQRGTTPQHLLTTILGDYWWGRREGLPSAALVPLAGEFGVTELAARAALSRLVRRGLLAAQREGRRTSYVLTEEADRVLTDGIGRILAFGTGAPAWDGTWVVAAFSVPERQRGLRHAVRTRLHWLGFAPLYDGMWISARPVAADARRVLTDLGVRQSTVLRSEAVGPLDTDTIVAAWDLDEVRRVYASFTDRFTPLHRRISKGAIGTREALVARTEVMDIWRTLPGLDPELPAELLPEDWPSATAHRLFVEIYDALGPLAEIRVRKIVAEHAPRLANLVRYHSSISVRG
jgi:phenylacetic acid degradation operon negative regulatory protein